MAKRAAEEYITKDQGSTPNLTDNRQGGPVKMATPAQLAARKLKTPKSRLGAARGNSAGAGFSSITAPNPFAPQQQQQQSTFPQVGANGGFSFGQQSQSFPPASTPQTSFNFTAPQASSFTFGQGTSQPAASSAPSFGFGSNNNTNPAPPVAPFSFGQTGQTNGQSTVSSNPFSFGHSTAQPNDQSIPAASPFSFGRTPLQPNGQSTPSAAPFSFGQATSQSTSANNTSTPQPTSLFGQQNNDDTTNAAQQSPFSFGQNVQPNEQNKTAGNLFSFGQKFAQPEVLATSETPKPAFSFGSNNNLNKQDFSQSVFSFGKTTETNSPIATSQTSTKFAFGESTPQPSTSSMFGQSTLGPAPSSLFGGEKSAFSFGSSTAPQETDDTMMMSPPRKASAAAQVQHRAPSPVREIAPPTSAIDSAPVSNTSPGQIQASNFSFGAPSTAPPTATTQNSLFGRISESPKLSFGAPANSSGSKSPTMQQSAAPGPRAPSPVAEAPQAPKSLFQNMTPVPEQPKPFTPAEPTSASTSLFQAPVSNLVPTSKSLFGSHAQANTRPTPSAAPQPAQESTRVVNKAPIEFEKVRLRSHGPLEPLITNDDDKWVEHDRKLRLLALNKEFVLRLSQQNPGTQDFDNLIIHYFRSREKLGLMWPPVARHKRKADDDNSPEERSLPAKKTKTTETPNGNTKRKADDDDPEDRSSLVKKTKTIESSSSNDPAPNINSSTPRSTFAATNSNFGGFTPAVASAIEAQSSSTFAAAKSNPIGTTPTPLSAIRGPSSKTSDLFQSMLSSNSAPSQSDKSNSPFANIFTTPVQPASTAFNSTPLPAVTKATALAKPASPASDETEDDNEDDEQEGDEESEEGSSNDDEEEERDGSEGHDQDGDSDGTDDEKEDEEAPVAKPENQGKSLFDRIQPPAPTSGEKELSTPNGPQDKISLKQPAPNHSFKPFTPFPPGVSKSTPQAPTISPLTPWGGSVKTKAAAIFEFTPKAATTTPTPVPGASIFAGGSVISNGPIPGEGLFGSRPSTPNNGDSAPTNIFAGFAKMPTTTIDSAKDNTWAKGTPLKFDTSQKSTKEAPKFGSGTPINFMSAFGKVAEGQLDKDKEKRKYEDLGSDADDDEIADWEKEDEEKQRAKRAKVSNFGRGGFKPSGGQSTDQAKEQTSSTPTFSLTAATPPPKSTANSEKFANLFGQKSPAASPAPSTTNSVGFSFGAVPSTESASALQPAASYLFASGNTSGLSSRATSPGGTDNESVDTNGEADATNDPQTSLMSERPGEENEEVLYEVRAKAMRYLDTEAAAKQKGSTPNAYNSVGLGILRVLKNAETGKARIVIRAVPGSNVLLNTHLAPFVNYTNDSRATSSGAVRIGVPTENDKIEQWVLKVRNSEKAVELADILTKNKSSP